MYLNISDFIRSSLTGLQRHWHTLLSIILVLILANTLFLLARRYGFGCTIDAVEACSVSVFYQAMVLLHSALGILLALAILAFGILHIPKNFRVAQIRPQLLLTGLFTLILLGILLWSGLHFLVNAKTTDMTWLYNTHLAAAAGIVALYFIHRTLARPRSAGTIIANGIGLVITLMLPFVGTELWVIANQSKLPIAKIATPIADGNFHPVTWVAPTSPFFPSPLSLTSGKATVSPHQLLVTLPTSELQTAIRQEVAKRGFAENVLIGAETCVRCHADTVEQWASSAHRFSSFNNPFYVATLEYLRDTPVAPNAFMQAHLDTFGLPASLTGRIKSRWCGGCHDPLLMLTGAMIQDVDKGSIQAQAGLTCLSCHLIKAIPNRTGNGNYVWNDQFKDSYIFSASKSDLGMMVHDTYLKANPERHKADMLKSFYRKADYCVTCHKVSLDRPVNEYRWLRGQNEFDAWHNSGIPHNAARTFYLPPGIRQCQDCHMPLIEAKLGDLAATNGMVRSHRFVAANSALPWLRGDTQAIARTSTFLGDSKLRLFIGGIALGTGTILPLTDGKQHTLATAFDHLELDVVVRNLNVGHTFPAGTNDSNEAWIEVSTVGTGGLSLMAGARGPDGQVSQNTRIYNAVAVDRIGKKIDKRNAHEMVAPIYIAVIPPSSSDLSRYTIPITKLGDLTAGVKVKVRLLWRKFNHTYTEFAYKANKPGFAQLGAIPDLPVTEIAAEELLVQKIGNDLVLQATLPKDVKPPALLHDYAIGFFLQGDFKSARQAVDKLLTLTPDCTNCLRTRARIEIAEGQFSEARQTLAVAETQAPADPQNAWLWAQVLLQEGDYAAAGEALNRVLAAFPEDRMAHKLMARVAYLDGRFQDSLTAVAKALAIDPEDATAHYYAMLAQRALGNTQQEKMAKAAYEYYKADETAQQATLAFRQTETDANFAAQKIKVFELQ